ncbi:MAG: DnaD domain-containing protein [Chloroflexota bacterium]
MKAFAGFPRTMRSTPLPNAFFSQLLPHIDDIVELKVTLYTFWRLHQKRGYPRYVTFAELAGDKLLVSSIGDSHALRQGLNLAVSRGTLVHLGLQRENTSEDLYFLNTERDREAAASVKRGEIDLGALPKPEPCQATREPPNIFILYEENIGMLTPMIAEELKEAEKVYPASWIEEAFREAVSLNIRKWRYIASILERWAAEGRQQHGKTRGYHKEDRDRYIKGRYGHVVRR